MFGMRWRMACVFVIALIIAGTALAQGTGGMGNVLVQQAVTVPDEPPGGLFPPTGPETYGIEDLTAYVVDPHDFHAYSAALGYTSGVDGYIHARSGDSFRFFDAGVHLPSGALVQYYNFFRYDNSDTGFVRLFWFKSSCPGYDGCTLDTLIDHSTDTAGTPGYVGFYDTFPTPITWRNSDRDTNQMISSWLRIYFSETGSGLRVGPIVLWYRRQISPAPATATFADVPTDHWAFQFVEALAASGITAGCGGGNYCPDSPITRAEMAVYLSAALGLHWAD